MTLDSAKSLIVSKYPGFAIYYPIVRYNNGYVFNMVPKGIKDPDLYCDGLHFVNSKGKIFEFSPVLHPDYVLPNVELIYEEDE